MSDLIIPTPPAEGAIWCTTCDVSPRWAGFMQCFGCLYDKVPPSDYAPKYVVGFDTEAAIAEIRRFRQQWEVKYPHFELVLDRQRMWPEVGHKSKYADRDTELIRKLYYARFRVERRHPRPRRSLLAAWEQMLLATACDLVQVHAIQSVMSPELITEEPIHAA